MLKILFFVLSVSFATNAEITKLSDIVVKDINGEDFRFKQFEGKCVLVITTASENGYTNQNMEYLNELTEKIPNLKIVAFPSNSFGKEPKNNEDLRRWFYDRKSDYYVMGKIDVVESNIFQFLARIAKGKKVNQDYTKYLIQKDGKTAEKFNSPAGKFVNDLTLNLKRCVNSDPPFLNLEETFGEASELSENVKDPNENARELNIISKRFVANKKKTKLSDFVVKDINGKDFQFKQFEGECVLIVITASRLKYVTKTNMEYLNKLTKTYSNLPIVAFPSNSIGDEPLNNAELKEWFSQINATYHVMEKTDVEKSEIFEFLKNSSGVDSFWNFYKYLVRNDGKTVKLYGPFGGFLLTKGLNDELKRCTNSVTSPLRLTDQP